MQPTSTPVLFLRKIKQLLTEPSHFFEAAAHEKGIGPALRTYVALSPLYLIAFFLIRQATRLLPLSQRLLWLSASPTYVFQELSRTAPLVVLPPLVAFFTFLFSYLLILPLIFVVAGLWHAWILIWGGKGTYADSFRVYVYGRVPRLLVGWIPIVGAFIWMYDAVLYISALQKLHNVSRTQAILILVLPTLVQVALTILMFVAVVSYLR